MTEKRMWIALLGLLILSAAAWGQGHKRDSLIGELRGASAQLQKIELAKNIGWLYRNDQPDSALHYLNGAARLAVQYKMTSELPAIYNMTGVCYRNKSNYGMALDFYLAASKLARSNSDTVEIAYAHNNIGEVMEWRGEYKDAFYHYTQAFKAFKSIGDKKGVAYASLRLAKMELRTKHYESAVAYFDTVIQLRIAIRDTPAIAVGYNGLAEVYIKKQEPEKAIKILLNNRRLYERFNDLRGAAFSSRMLGEAYLAAKNYDEAMKAASYALLFYESENKTLGRGPAELVMAKAFWGKGNVAMTIHYLEKTIEHGTETESKETQRDAYFLLVQAYKSQNKASEAVAALEKYIILKDSLANIEQAQELGRQQGSFEMYKKDMENELLRKETAANQQKIQKQQIVAVFLMVMIAILAIMAIVLYYANLKNRTINQELTIKNKQIEEQNAIIEAARKELQKQNELLEEKVVKRTLDLQNSNEELFNYAHLVSHDLKEPLRNIKNFSYLLERETNAATPRKDVISKYLAFIKDGTQYMEMLLHDVLQYAQFTGEHDSNLTRLNIQEIIELVKQNSITEIHQHQVSIEYDYLPAEIYGIKIKIIQLFQNLILNAIKYRKESEKPHIFIAAKAEKSQWIFSIADNGIGVAKEYHQIIFERFRQLNPKAKYGGIGLGLATCKRIVEQHGGSIWVESEAGSGATFFFTIKKPVFLLKTSINEEGIP